MDLEKYFEKFRKNIIGNDTEFETPYGTKKMIYADWIASGRLYGPIEDLMKNKFGPMVGNTHSEASETGVTMTMLYKQAKQIIKDHVNASTDDCILTEGSGMTGAIHKLLRLLGLNIPDQAEKYIKKDIPREDIPVVFVTYLEHHSNHTSWLETVADVVVLFPEELGADMISELEKEIVKYKDRKLKIGSFSAGSNVTGIIPPYHKLSEVMHRNGGIAFADFAASAPYIKVNMHPENEEQKLDAIFFSPHKALGGPGSSGVLIFNKELYKSKRPDNPGGGTVLWTNRWNEYAYLENIEDREDGGTPAFLQTMRVALTIRLKEKMGIKNILEREHQLLQIAYKAFDKIPELHILADMQRERLSVISFYVDDVHHNLIVKLLNDRFGIQVRGGCSCAGTYGHYLLHVTKPDSYRISEMIDAGDFTEKLGWVRLSVHPTMTDKELDFILDAIKQVIENIKDWEKDYVFDKGVGEFFHKDVPRLKPEDFNAWFDV
ncbi:MAG: aminotransferase class V-fold PLP-dependent enzyme [Bacteroidales bacterium]|nr:aminotransferase class V-fold PLP-dependent enzyme [Bacteroidales bacterium]